MLRYLLKRTFWGLFTLALFITLMFFLVHLLLPGDFTSQLVFQLSREDRIALQQELGLDLPIWQRYLSWLSGLVTLDLGMSYRGVFYGTLPVSRIIVNALPYTLLFFVAGLATAVVIGYRLGKWSAWRGPGFRTGLITFVALALYSSFPPWMAYLVVSASVPQLRGLVKVFPQSINTWLRNSGYSVSGFTDSYAEDPATIASYLVLSLVIGIVALVGLNALGQHRSGKRVPYRFGLPILFLGIVGVWFLLGIGQAGLAFFRLSSIPIATFILVAFAEFMLIISVSVSHAKSEPYIALAKAKGLPDNVVRDRHAARNALLPFLARVVVAIPYMLTAIVIIESIFGWPGLGYELGLSRGQSDVPAMIGILVVIGIISLLSRIALEVIQYALDPRIRDRQLGLDASYREQAGSQLFNLRSSRRLQVNKSMLIRQQQNTQRRLSRIKRGWSIFAQNRLALLGLGILIVFVLMALAHPLLLATSVWPSGIYDPVTAFDVNVEHPSLPSSSHLLGTTIKGLDIFSMLLAGTGHSITLGLTAGFVGALIGTILGAIAAYFGCRTDTVLSQISDVFLLLSPPIFMSIFSSFYQQAGPILLGISYGLIAGLGGIAIVMRSHALTIVTKPFVVAGQAAGGSAAHIISKHVMPHMVSMAFLQMLLAVVGAVIMDGVLSFSSTTRYTVNWGTMLVENELLHEVLGKGTQWFAIFPPVFAFTLFGLAFYLVSRGVGQVADPKLRQA